MHTRNDCTFSTFIVRLDQRNRSGCFSLKFQNVPCATLLTVWIYTLLFFFFFHEPPTNRHIRTKRLVRVQYGINVSPYGIDRARERSRSWIPTKIFNWKRLLFGLFYIAANRRNRGTGDYCVSPGRARPFIYYKQAEKFIYRNKWSTANPFIAAD